jgi:hypothetical protein
MQRSTAEFFKQSGCIACHHQDMTSLTLQAARKRQLPVDEQLAADVAKIGRTQWASRHDLMMQRLGLGGEEIHIAYNAVGLAASGVPADQATDALVAAIADRQYPDGHWVEGFPARPPMEEGEVHRTAFCVRALKAYAPPARQADIEQRIVLARKWLWEAPLTNTDDRAMQLLGLTGPASRGAAASSGEAIVSLQHPDGGWSQNPYTASDAYATGLVLTALAHSGALSPTDKTYRRGVAFPARDAEAGRLLARGQPCPQVPAVLRERLSARARPVDLHDRDRLGRYGLAEAAPEPKKAAALR